MAILWHEVAKFASGIAAWESFTHLSLLVSGATPTIFGIRMTKRLNAIQTIVPGILAILLGWWAWS